MKKTQKSKVKEYKDLKTDEEFDEWFGRKPGWRTCEHDFASTSHRSVWDDIYQTSRCMKCGVSVRM